ncbi:hypothetical protein PG996_006763 [Apiospora saccharicola]|uniref:F-box domain-containing protein n=1 Tax=Apiospora saccharicola TaxID=335842 RepID=A0ABR1V8Y0_9PEZI
MDRLSFEIMSLILDNLPEDEDDVDEYDNGPKLAPYSTISRRWQAVVEARTFASVTIREQAETPTVFSPSPYRSAALRKVEFRMDLPSDSETRAHHRQNQSAGIKRFFQFRDEEMGVLPNIRVVSRLKLWSHDGPDFSPLALCQFATRFTCLRKLELSYCDLALKRSAQRKTHRAMVADGISSLGQLPYLTKLVIRHKDGSEPANHSFKTTCLEHESSVGTVDLLCEAIRKLAQKGILEILRLNGELVSPDLFRNRRSGLAAARSGQQEEEVQAEWPSLQHLLIEAPIVAPSGRWYYTGEESDVEPFPTSWGSLRRPRSPKGDDEVETGSEALSDADMDDGDEDAEANGDDPIHRWRTVPDPAEFDQLAIDLAAAVKLMPRLKTCVFCLGPIEDMSMTVGIQYAEAGEEIPWFTDEKYDGDLTGRRWWVRTGENTAWEVPKELNSMCAEWAGPDSEFVV